MVLLILFGALAASAVSGADCNSPVPTMDGHWWLLLTAEEKDGYLNGDADCYLFERQRKFAHPKSTTESVERVTNFYHANPDKRSLPVFQAARIVDELPSLYVAEKGGETWNEPHGYWDGMWWRQGSPADRLGFVEGYLACYRSNPPLGRRTYSRTPAQYVALINVWYKLDEENGLVDPEREDEKIANVLLKFSDDAEGASPDRM